MPTPEQYRSELATILRKGKDAGYTDDRLRQLGERYLERRGITRSDLPWAVIGQTSEGRPIVRNPKGGLSTELSITIDDPRAPGKYINLPSLFGGKPVEPRDAIERVSKAGWKDPETGRPIESFGSISEAEQAARARTQSLSSDPRFIEAEQSLGRPQAQRQETAAMQLSGRTPYSGEDRLYIDPNAARLAGGMAAMGAGMAGPQAAIPEEVLTVPLAGGVAGEAAKLYNWLAGSGPKPTVGGAFVDTVEDAAGGAAFKAGAPIVGKVLKETVRSPARLLRGSAAETLQDFQQTGIPLAGQAGAITGNKGTQGLEAVLRKLPTSAALYQEADEMANAAFRLGGQDVAATAGRAGEPVNVGRRVIKGLDTFADRVRAKGRVYFGGIKQAIGKDTPVAAQDTASHVDEIIAPFREADGTLSPAARSSVPPIIKDIAAELQAGKGAVSWERMDALRRSVGEKLADPTLIEPNSQGQLRRLYGVLTQDMERIAEAKGGDVLKKWKAAKRYWAAAMDRIDMVREVASKQETEDAFNAAFSGLKDGPTRLRSLKKSLPKDVWNDLVATKITQMLDATPGLQNATGTVSSPASFLTRWNDMKEPVKATLFGANTPLRNQMNRLARVADAIKDTAREKNFSNTGAANFFIRMLTDVPQAVAQTALGAGAGLAAGGASVTPIAAGVGAALATPYITARAMMNPDVVKWLADGALIAQRGTTRSMGVHIARLAAIENANPDVASDIRAIRRQLDEYRDRDQ